MTDVRFVNPNNPSQPQAGVYVWYVTKNRKRLNIYVGRAGGGQCVFLRGTLFRGASELQQNAISTDAGKSLDTDFIVGSAIKYFKRRKWVCYWKHIDDDPAREKALTMKYKPVLQRETTSRILDIFRNKSGNKKRWRMKGKSPSRKRAMVQAAEELIFKQLRKIVSI